MDSRLHFKKETHTLEIFLMSTSDNYVAVLSVASYKKYWLDNILHKDIVQILKMYWLHIANYSKNI